jgi:DNA-binding transcriptional regulator GbsR (MarR family)
MQLVKAGCRKCDFFVKQEYYEVFLSQIPTLETRRSISSLSNERLSEILSTTNPDNTAQKKKRRVEFMGEEFNNIADKYKNSEYIEYVG